ncbi:MAG: HAD hydrolase family protein [Streptosporangiaceae bacterium]
MSLVIALPDEPELRLDHLLLDVNGTLTDRGGLIRGVADRVARAGSLLDVRLLSADTYGTLADVAQEVGAVAAERVHTGADKKAAATRLGPATCAAIGNGTNDTELLRTVALGIAVLGPEGASSRALAAADVVCGSIADALDLLLDPRALTATLRR